MGRSHCNKCDRQLKSKDLIPVFSYIKTKGKCIKCKKKIPLIYPILEICMWLLFIGIAYFMIDTNLIFTGNSLEISKLLFWLFLWFVTIIYTFYDILFLEIPESVLALGIIVTLILLAIQSLFPSFHIATMLPAATEIHLWITLAVIWSIIIVSILYVVMLKELSEIYDIILLAVAIGWLLILKYTFDIELSQIAIVNGIIGVLWIFLFFFLQILVSKWAWMWGWDLRIAILIGLLLWVSLSFAGMMITYMVGSVIGVAAIVFSRLRKWWETSFNTQIPFGPFLAAWFFITLFFQENILQFINFYL